MEENVSIDSNISENNNSEEPIVVDENTTDEEVTEEKKETSTVLTGKAIDGYISGASIIFGKHKARSKSNGSWLLEIKDKNFKPKDISFINISGGIDQSTGKAFEGVLSNVMEADSFHQVTKTAGTDINSLSEIANFAKVMITPMTTVVSHYFKDNKADGLSLENAKNQISKAMGIDPDFLSKDPIEELKKPESKTKAAKYLKASLKIQKLTESLSKSLVSDEVDFSNSFTSVMRTFAEKIGKENKTDFVKMITEDMGDFAKSVISKMSQDLSSEKQAENFLKLKSSGEITSQVAIALDKIDTENMDPEQYSNVAKATEEVTSSVEEKIETLAQTDLNLSEESIEQINSGENVDIA